MQFVSKDLFRRDSGHTGLVKIWEVSMGVYRCLLVSIGVRPWAEAPEDKAERVRLETGDGRWEQRRRTWHASSSIFALMSRRGEVGSRRAGDPPAGPVNP